MSYYPSRLPSRIGFGFSFLLSIGLVCTSIILAQLLNLAACPLCIVQRMLYLTVALLAALGFLAGRQRNLAAIMALLMTVAAAAGAFVAGYQSYLQRFARDTQCSGTLAWWERLVDWAGEKIPLLFGASGLCTEPGWKFIGLSIAEWSLVAFCVMTLIGLYVFLKQRRK
jgi:disulfide bond formation protein DsbB